MDDEKRNLARLLRRNRGVALFALTTIAFVVLALWLGIGAGPTRL